MGPLADSLAAPAQLADDVFAENAEFADMICDTIDHLHAASSLEVYQITAESLIAMMRSDTYKLCTVIDVVHGKIVQSPAWSKTIATKLYGALLGQPGLNLLQDDDFGKGSVDGVELASKRIMDNCANACDQIFTCSDNWRSKQAGRVIDFAIDNLEMNGTFPSMVLVCDMLERMAGSFYTFWNSTLYVLEDFCLRVYRPLDDASPDHICERLTMTVEDLYNTDKQRSPAQNRMLEGMLDTMGRYYSVQLEGEHATLRVQSKGLTQDYDCWHQENSPKEAHHNGPSSSAGISTATAENASPSSLCIDANVYPGLQPSDSHMAAPTNAIESHLDLKVFDRLGNWRQGAAAHLVKQIRERTTLNMAHASEDAAFETFSAMIGSKNLFSVGNLRLLSLVLVEKGPVLDGKAANMRSSRLTQLLDRLRRRAEKSSLEVRHEIESLRKVLGRDDKVFGRPSTMNTEIGPKLLDVEETLVDGVARLNCVD